MNCHFTLAFGFLAFGAGAFAQTSSAVSENIRAAYSIDRFSDGIVNEMIYGIPLPAPKMVGDTYIDDEWKRGGFLMYGHEKAIDGHELRYDLDQEELEIRTSKGTKVVSGNQVKSFVTIDPDEADPSMFINAREFNPGEGVRFKGFLRVLEDGDYAFLSGYSVKVKRPDYNEALNVGSRDYKIYKKEQLFYVVNGVLAPLPARRKDFISIFPGRAREGVADYMNSENLNPSDKTDLIAIFRYYNQRLK